LRPKLRVSPRLIIQRFSPCAALFSWDNTAGERPAKVTDFLACGLSDKLIAVKRKGRAVSRLGWTVLLYRSLRDCCRNDSCSFEANHPPRSDTQSCSVERHVRTAHCGLWFCEESQMCQLGNQYFPGGRSAHFMAPEIHESADCDWVADVHAYGMLVYVA
jgi:hypothetical protein